MSKIKGKGAKNFLQPGARWDLQENSQGSLCLGKGLEPSQKLDLFPFPIKKVGITKELDSLGKGSIFAMLINVQSSPSRANRGQS
jgi:hypothetical protein